jgi:hypothetical protein
VPENLREAAIQNKCDLHDRGFVSRERLFAATFNIVNMIKRNKRSAGRALSSVATGKDDWRAIMDKVWRAQSDLKPGELVSNPVLSERQRKRR